VNVYTERAKAKFGVATRAQAILLATRAGMIAACNFPHPPEEVGG
jgi:hypothetical protein